MNAELNRRIFSRTALLSLSASALPAWGLKKRNLEIGHTGLTWIPLGGAGACRLPR